MATPLPEQAYVKLVIVPDKDKDSDKPHAVKEILKCGRSALHCKLNSLNSSSASVSSLQ